MKWPSYVALVRHDVSEYNELKKLKKKSEAYRLFEKSFKENPESEDTKALAELVFEEIQLGFSDMDTRLANKGANALVVGQNLKHDLELPDVIFVSPYKRTRCTLAKLVEGWPELASVPVYEEERIREQEHGLATLYNDYKIFHAFHPEQRRFQELHGDLDQYWYRWPQGESVPDVRDRVRSWLNTLTRDWDGQKVLAVTHHLTILSLRAALERLSAEEFVNLDHEMPPINCGVTLYRGDPTQGHDGKLLLEYYNKKFY